MNPFSFYEHQPQLVQAIVVAATAVATRRHSAVVPPALVWSSLGVLDWALYAFGSGVQADAELISAILGWAQLGVVLWGAAIVVTRAAAAELSAPPNSE